MNEFKLSKKKIHNDDRSSIEEIHNKKMLEMVKNLDNINNLKKKLLKLEQYYNILLKKSSLENEKIKIHNNILKLKKEINDIESGNEMMDYISKAWEFIYNIDNEEIIETVKSESQNIKSESQSIKSESQSIKSESQSIKSENQSIKSESQNNIYQYIDKIGSTNKGQIYNRYINKCFKNINIENINNEYKCNNCSSNDFIQESGEIICNNCGVCEKFLDSSFNGLNYDDIKSYEPQSQPFSYQRKNHFKEWLNQLQAKEITNIPDCVINLLLGEIKKERINNIESIDSTRIKKYLKKLKLNKYYEHVPNIISKITNSPQLRITPEFEKILLDLFDLIQEPFKKHCPENRKNFLSYSYTLHKFCQLLKKDEYLIYFPLLKSREKLFEQENIWKNICKELNWEFKACI